MWWDDWYAKASAWAGAQIATDSLLGSLFKTPQPGTAGGIDTAVSERLRDPESGSNLFRDLSDAVEDDPVISSFDPVARVRLPSDILLAWLGITPPTELPSPKRVFIGAGDQPSLVNQAAQTVTAVVKKTAGAVGGILTGLPGFFQTTLTKVLIGLAIVVVGLFVLNRITRQA